MESILETIKKMLGLTKEYDAYDTDIIVDINSVLMIVQQLGIGPSNPFTIHGYNETWSDLTDSDKAELLKSYIYLKVRLMFDPPSNSFLVTAIEKQIQEYEWRLLVQADEKKNPDFDDSDGAQNPENPDGIEPISNEEIDKMFGF